MIRSGHAGWLLFWLASAALGAALVLLLFRAWAAAAGAAGGFVLLAVSAGLLLQRADSRVIRAQADKSERWVEAWGRGIGALSGGWDPPAGQRSQSREKSGRRD